MRNIFSILLAAMLISVGCSSPAQTNEFDIYAEMWKKSTPQKRNEVEPPQGFFEHLRGKNRKEITRYLGEPDAQDRKMFYYDFGPEVANGYYFTLKIVFDEDGKIEEIYWDD